MNTFLIRALVLTLEKFAMKKTLIALAAVAVSGAAFAQSTVTLSGQFGTAYDSSDFAASSVGRTDGNLNVTVTEDLGGGLKFTGVAGFDLANRGAGVNGRSTSFTLAGGFGSLNYGTTLANLNLRTGAVSGLSLSKGLQFVTGGEAVVSILQYTTPQLAPGLTLNINSIQLGTANKTDNIGDATTVAVNYANGPLSAALDYRSFLDRTRGTVTYDFGVAKAAVGFISSYTGMDDSQIDMDIAVPVGAFTIGAQYVKRGDNKGTAVGVSYALSKRTSINLATANIDTTSDAGAAYDGKQTRLRLNHTF
jgi:hypothetical protein